MKFEAEKIFEQLSFKTLQRKKPELFRLKTQPFLVLIVAQFEITKPIKHTSLLFRPNKAFQRKKN